MKVMAGGAKPTPFYKWTDKLSKLTGRSPAGSSEVAMRTQHRHTIPSIVDNEQLDENMTP